MRRTACVKIRKEKKKRIAMGQREKHEKGELQAACQAATLTAGARAYY